MVWYSYNLETSDVVWVLKERLCFWRGFWWEDRAQFNWTAKWVMSAGSQSPTSWATLFDFEKVAFLFTSHVVFLYVRGFANTCSRGLRGLISGPTYLREDWLDNPDGQPCVPWHIQDYRILERLCVIRTDSHVSADTYRILEYCRAFVWRHAGVDQTWQYVFTGRKVIFNVQASIAFVYHFRVHTQYPPYGTDERAAECEKIFWVSMCLVPATASFKTRRVYIMVLASLLHIVQGTGLVIAQFALLDTLPETIIIQAFKIDKEDATDRTYQA